MERRVKFALENTFLMLPLYELGENFVILLLIIFLLQFSLKSLFLDIRETLQRIVARELCS